MLNYTTIEMILYSGYTLKMARKKRRQAVIVRRKRKLKKFHHEKRFFLSVLIIILLIIYFGSSFLIRGQNKVKLYKISTSIPLKRTAPKLPLVIPSPTLTATPTPAPLLGFCLKVPVLMYHHIQPEATAKELGQTSLTVDNGIFDQQMSYLGK
jgi:hypothetical protein